VKEGRAANQRVLRLGIVGCGHISSGRLHPSLHALPIDLVAVCDTDEDRARTYARTLGGETVYTDHTEMLAEAELDAVIACVGPSGHPRIAIDAMEAGVPVLTEKPPAVNSADVAAMVETSRKTGQICMTAFNKRFAPVYQMARAVVEGDEFGPPSLLSVDWCSEPWYSEDADNPNSWFLLDFAIHVMDISRFLFGEVAGVYARKRGEEAYGVTLAFENGAVGVLALSSNRQARLTERVELTGKVGQFVTIDDGRTLVRYREREIGEWHDTAHAVSDSFEEAGYRGELAEFVAAVQEGREPQSPVSSAYETMRLYEAIDLSAREQRSVELAELG
jgi:predicted dehydrogenase